MMTEAAPASAPSTSSPAARGRSTSSPSAGPSPGPDLGRGAAAGLRRGRRVVPGARGRPVGAPPRSAELEGIALDVRFPRVRAWRERTGGRAVGHLPVYAPREVIEAAGMLPVGVHAGRPARDHPRRRVLPVVHLPDPAERGEMGLAGHLDVCDGMLFPATCDVIRTSRGEALLFPGKLVRYVDVPRAPTRGPAPASSRTRCARWARRSAPSRAWPRPTTGSARPSSAQRAAPLIRELYDRAPSARTSVHGRGVRRRGRGPPAPPGGSRRPASRVPRRGARLGPAGARPGAPGSWSGRSASSRRWAHEDAGAAGCYIVDDDLVLGARFRRRTCRPTATRGRRSPARRGYRAPRR